MAALASAKRLAQQAELAVKLMQIKAEARKSALNAEAALLANKCVPLATRRTNENAINVEARERQRIRDHERRTHLGFTPNPYTPEQWLALCDRHDNRCARCGCDGPLTVDHILPVSKGGLNNIENIQPLCFSCNSKKYNDDTDYRKAA